MLELDYSFIINLVFWILLLSFLISAMLVGFSAVEYQRFNSNIQEVLARSGTFHVNQGKCAKDPYVINNPQILEMIKDYGYRWVVEPVPNLTAYDSSTLTSWGVKAVLPKSQWDKVNLSDYEHENGSRKMGEVKGAYFYDKLENNQESSESLRNSVADAYNSGHSILGLVRPQYLDLSDYDANKFIMFRAPGGQAKTLKDSLYYPSHDHASFNGVIPIYSRAYGLSGGESFRGYTFSKNNPWTLFVEKNGQEPHVKYASQVAYLIVPNVNPRGESNTSGLHVGLWRFVLNVGMFNSRGRVQLVTNQIRSIGNAKTASDMGSLSGVTGSGGHSEGAGSQGWKPLMT